MNDEQSTPLDEQLLPMLLACDQALAAGAVGQEPPDSDPPSGVGAIAVVGGHRHGRPLHVSGKVQHAGESSLSWDSAVSRDSG